MEPIVKIWQFPKNNKNLQDLVTLAQFFTKNPMYDLHWIFFCH